MVLCEGCKADDHGRCPSQVHISWPKNDRYRRRPHGHRVGTCDCVCRRPAGWRGAPQALPPMPRSLR